MTTPPRIRTPPGRARASACSAPTAASTSATRRSDLRPELSAAHSDPTRTWSS
ncbi:hypothetical protein LV779_26595 [Streptomyces thinghirensis]|nr:hypothetical protein [Streptomyces thinghirensis]